MLFLLIFLVSFFNPAIWVVLILSAINARLLSPKFFRTKENNSVAIVINPRPPICINVIITICPNKLQCVAVSTKTSPVTHDADTAVNIDVSTGVDSPLCEATGNDSNTVPSNRNIEGVSTIESIY